jgi:diguanylate cyclase (GGDEF)-like protein
MGIRVRLSLAFAAIGGLAVMASGVAWLTNGQSADGLTGLVRRDMPRLAALSSLNQSAAALMAVAPGLLFATSDEALAASWRHATVARDAFTYAVERARGHLDGPGILAEVDALAAGIGGSLDRLHEARSRSLNLAAHKRSYVEQLDILQQEYRMLVGLLKHDRPADLALLTQANRALVLFGEVGRATDGAGLAALEARLDNVLPTIVDTKDGIAPQAMAAFAARLVAATRGDSSLFALKRREFAAQAEAAAALEDLNQRTARLEARVAAITAAAQSGVQANYLALSGLLVRGRVLVAVSAGLALVVALLIAWRYVGASVIQRLRILSVSMRAIAAGDLTALIPTAGDDEISDMGRALLVFRDALAHVRHLATHDMLTGLANRRLLEERLGEDLARPRAAGAVFYINLRGFRDINDTFGHGLGDRVLLILADRLRWAARVQDLPARLGGDDFVLLVPGLSDRAAVEARLDALDRALSAPVAADAMEIEVQPAIGVACYPMDGDKARDVLHHADMAMNQARLGEARQVCHYTAEMGREARRRKTIRADLRQGIKDGQFALHFQPKVDMISGEVSGAEALVRWTHPERGCIGPADFIPEAERSGLILPLGTYVLREGCRQARLWLDGGLKPIRVAVNMSPVQILRQDIVGVVAQALEDHCLSPDLLEIEITEGVLLREEDKALQRLKDLRTLGVHLAIDDFGTGYSSLSYLKRLPVSCLKIDQTFVRHLTTNREDVRLTRIIIGMAHDFGLEVVAEGVETLDHARFLRHEGCDLGQGYYFSRPLAAPAFEALVAGEPPWRDGAALLRKA